MKLRLLGLVGVIAIIGPSLVQVDSATALTCVTYDIVGARGTNAPPQDDDNDGYIPEPDYTAANGGIGDVTQHFIDTFGDLLTAQSGTYSQYGVHYPARGGFPLIMKFDASEADFLPELRDEWNDSYHIGSADIADHVHDVLSFCPATKFILIGYSQGAEVVADSLGMLQTGEEDSIAAIAVLGDPEFNPHDEDVDRGNFATNRYGMWGSRDLWSEATDAPVFSYCHFGDIACNGGMNDQAVDSELQPIDFTSLLEWSRQTYASPNIILEHGIYATDNSGTQAAFDIAEALGIPFSHDFDPPVDVALLVDSTAIMSSQVDQLQSGITDLTDAVDDANDNHRYAVVEFKGNGIGNDFATQVDQPFTDDAGDIDDAVGAIDPSGGTIVGPGFAAQAAGFSGVVAAANLGWRDYARKIILLISGNQIGYDDPDGEENGSGLTSDDAAAALKEAGARMYSISSSDDSGNGEWESLLSRRTIEFGANGDIITAALTLLSQAIRTPETRLAGSFSAEPGDTVEFSAEGTTSYVSAEPDISYYWSACWKDPNIAQSRSYGTTPSSGITTCGGLPDIPDVENPEEGVRHLVEFADPGDYTVWVYSTTDDGDHWGLAAHDVHVFDDPSSPPAAARVTRSNDPGSEQHLVVHPQPGEEAQQWVLKNPEGEEAMIFTAPADGFDMELDGVSAAEAANWTVVARNPEGDTPSLETVPVSSAVYEHRTTSVDGPHGATFTLSGPTSPVLESIAANHAGPGDVSAIGDYDSWFLDSGDSGVGFDMNEADVNVDIETNGWTITYSFGSQHDLDDNVMWQTMKDWLASAVLDHGSVSLQLDGRPVSLRLGDGTSTSQVNLGVIDANATPPAGLEVDVPFADSSGLETRMTSADPLDLQLLPVADEIANPASHDWGTSTISDVHVYSDGKELEFPGTIAISAVDPASTTQTLNITMWGVVGDGSAATMRTFLQDGVVTFRVDNGSMNALELHESAIDAEGLWE